MGDSRAKKQAYFVKLVQLLQEYNKILIVEADNVGSAHMQRIRISLRGQAVVLMGKNTMIRKAIRGYVEKNKGAPNMAGLEELMQHVRGNVGFVFTKGDLAAVKAKVVGLRVEAPAKVGTFAPNDVVVPAGPTGLEPTQTSFLQALNIPSKINKGQVEIQNDHQLLKKGDKIGQSEAALLQKLNIKPFTYGMVMKMVYDQGSIYTPEVLDLTDQDILNKFLAGLRNVAATGLGISFPTTAAVPHLVINAYKTILGVGLATEGITFKRLEKLKEAMKNPGAAAPAPAAAKDDKKPAGKPAAEAKKEEKKKEPEPEPEEEDIGLSLFDS
jgi:large subunit ribosomal protein LP0